MRLLAVTLLMASFMSPVTIDASQGASQCHFVNAKGQNEDKRSCDVEPAACMSVLLRHRGEESWFLKKGCSRLNGAKCSHTAVWSRIYDICEVHCCNTTLCNDTPTEWSALLSGHHSQSPSTKCAYAGEFAITEAPNVAPSRTTTTNTDLPDTTASHRNRSDVGTTLEVQNTTTSTDSIASASQYSFESASGVQTTPRTTDSAGFPTWAVIGIAVAVLAFGVCLVILIVVIACCGRGDSEQSSAEDRSTLVQVSARASDDEPTDRTQSMRSQRSSEPDLSRRLPPAISSQRSNLEYSQLSTSERNSSVVISQH